MESREQDSTYLQRLAALKLLRENMYYARPNTYNSLDFMDDLPGGARRVAPQFGEVLPSAAIISRDPEQRKAQIKEALKRIEATKESKSALGKQIVSNAVNMGLGSIPVGFLLSSAFNLMGFRWVKNRAGKWQSPVTPIRNTKRLFTRPHFRNRVAAQGVNDALIGAGMGAVSGAAYPILAHNSDISPKAMDEAAKIMQEQPYITSLPVADMISVIREERNKKHRGILNRVSNIGIGAGLGAGLGAIGAMTPALAKAPIKAVASALAKKPIWPGVAKGIAQAAKTDVPNMALTMGAFGGLGGAFTDNIIQDEAQAYKSDQV
jgi:hypothetical protein